MRFKQRYRFWNVFWVVLGLYILLVIIGIIGLAIMRSSEESKLTALFTRNYLIKMCIGFVFNVLFFYFTTNYFFNLIAEKKKFLSFLKVSLVAFLACFAYYHVVFFALPTKAP